MVGGMCSGRLDYVPSEIEDRGASCEIRQMSGEGTRGSSYVYIVEGGRLVNVGDLRGAGLVDVERWGGRRKLEIYRIPKELLRGREVLIISFTRSGWPFIVACRVEDRVSCYSCPDDDEFVRKLVGMFPRVVGGERRFLEFYERYAPKLVEDIKSVAVSSGAQIVFGGHASRLEELIMRGVERSLLTLLAIPSWQGRLLALQGRLSSLSEIRTIAAMIRAVGGETLPVYSSPDTRYWRIEYTNNEPFAYIRSRGGEEYTFYHQPTIAAHIKLDESPQRIHTTPDIVVFRGRVDVEPRGPFGSKYGSLGEALKQHRPLALVEVKLGLETTEWSSPNYMVRQLMAYKNALKPEHPILAVLLPAPHKRIFEDIGFKVFDNLLSEDGIRKFEDYIRGIMP